jgi:hypothetical protein
MKSRVLFGCPSMRRPTHHAGFHHLRKLRRPAPFGLKTVVGLQFSSVCPFFTRQMEVGAKYEHGILLTVAFLE